jgi:hypothetical protein
MWNSRALARQPASLPADGMIWNNNEMGGGGGVGSGVGPPASLRPAVGMIWNNNERVGGGCGSA